MDNLVAPSEIIKVLLRHEHLMFNWKTFATELGLEPHHKMTIISRHSVTGNYYELFADVIEIADSLRICTVGKVKQALMKMDFEGIAESLNTFSDKDRISYSRTVKEKSLTNPYLDLPNDLSLMETDWPFQSKGILGAGCFGIVVHAKHLLDGCDYALKIIPISLSDVGEKKYGVERKVLREVESLSKINQVHHDNVVRYKSTANFRLTPKKLEEVLLLRTPDLYTSDMGETLSIKAVKSLIFDATQLSKLTAGLFILTEVCGETVRKWLQQKEDWNVRQAGEVCKGVVAGLMHIHAQGIIHRDLRPDNVLFSKHGFIHPVKIGDFGSAILCESNSANLSKTEAVGNHLYRAPEMEGKTYTHIVDVYSLGLLIYEVFEPTESQAEAGKKFRDLCYRRKLTVEFRQKYPELANLVMELTEENPQDRCSLESVTCKISDSKDKYSILSGEIPTQQATNISDTNPPVCQVSNHIPGTQNSQIDTKQTRPIVAVIYNWEDIEVFVEVRFKGQAVSILRFDDTHVSYSECETILGRKSTSLTKDTSIWRFARTLFWDIESTISDKDAEEAFFKSFQQLCTLIAQKLGTEDFLTIFSFPPFLCNRLGKIIENALGNLEQKFYMTNHFLPCFLKVLNEDWGRESTVIAIYHSKLVYYTVLSWVVVEDGSVSVYHVSQQSDNDNLDKALQELSQKGNPRSIRKAVVVTQSENKRVKGILEELQACFRVVEKIEVMQNDKLAQFLLLNHKNENYSVFKSLWEIFSLDAMKQCGSHCRHQEKK